MRYIDSTGLGVLIGGLKRVREHGGSVNLVCTNPQIRKIFDITGQRERAINEYRQAIQTNDDTFGALEEARKYMAKAFERPKNKE